MYIDRDLQQYTFTYGNILLKISIDPKNANKLHLFSDQLLLSNSGITQRKKQSNTLTSYVIKRY